MIGTDEDAIYCDLAETYHMVVDDLESVPIMTLARLCVGLRDDSRIKMRMMDVNGIAPSFALIRISDTLTKLTHALAAQEGAPMPKLYADIMIGKQEEAKGFDSIEEFEEARRRLMNG